MAADAAGPHLKLLGLRGFCEGEMVLLAPGAYTVGRSRSCEFSLRRCPRYLQADPKTRDEDRELQTVSRRHLRVTVAPDGRRVTLEDLGSSNGTFICGERVQSLAIDNLDQCCYDVRLGTRETVRLQRGAVTTPCTRLPRGDDAPTESERGEAAIATEREAPADAAGDAPAAPRAGSPSASLRAGSRDGPSAAPAADADADEDPETNRAPAHEAAPGDEGATP